MNTDCKIAKPPSPSIWRESLLSTHFCMLLVLDLSLSSFSSTFIGYHRGIVQIFVVIELSFFKKSYYVCVKRALPLLLLKNDDNIQKLFFYCCWWLHFCSRRWKSNTVAKFLTNIHVYSIQCSTHIRCRISLLANNYIAGLFVTY